MKKFIVGLLVGALVGAAGMGLATPNPATQFEAELAKIEKDYSARVFSRDVMYAVGANESSAYTLRLIARQLNHLIRLHSDSCPAQP